MFAFADIDGNVDVAGIFSHNHAGIDFGSCINKKYAPFLGVI
jgi:hypothetical protein